MNHTFTSTPSQLGITTDNEPLAEPVDILLADTAIRVQLSYSNYQKAVDRYNVMQKWIEREDSEIRSFVELFYPQGSMAIGSTIASKLKNDEFDVDIVVQMSCARNIEPQIILDALYRSIKGQKGSRYYDCTKRNSRCVTVHYADGMHIDFTPSVLLPERLERTSHIFHHKVEEPSYYQRTLTVNPYGFAEWFKRETAVDSDFAQLYETRAIEYENIVLGKADAEELPRHEPVYKSMSVVALQLLKRWRNVQYDEREVRQPPSVMMSKFAADTAGQSKTLSQELLLQARHMHFNILQAHKRGQTINVMNPACNTHDNFTDRWPKDLGAQKLFLDDLDSLIFKLDKLCSGNLSISEIQNIMVELFGENPTVDVFREWNRRVGRTIQQGHAHTNSSSGSLDIAASGLLGIGAAEKARAEPTVTKSKKHTFYGDASD